MKMGNVTTTPHIILKLKDGGIFLKKLNKSTNKNNFEIFKLLPDNLEDAINLGSQMALWNHTVKNFGLNLKVTYFEQLGNRIKVVFQGTKQEIKETISTLEIDNTKPINFKILTLEKAREELSKRSLGNGTIKTPNNIGVKVSYNSYIEDKDTAEIIFEGDRQTILDLTTIYQYCLEFCYYSFLVKLKRETQ